MKDIEITKDGVLNKVLPLQLAFKKVNNYTSVELIAFIKLNSSITEYWVMRKGKAVIKTKIIDEAINKYNSITSLTLANENPSKPF